MNLNNIKSGFNLSKINENFQRLADMANNQVLYRDTPAGQANQMEVDLDMNNHRIYNTKAPEGPYDLVRWIDVEDLGGTVVPGPPPPAPAPPSGGGDNDFFRIAVIGDSLSGQQGLFDSAWPALLEQALNGSGANAQVKNFAINGYTYFAAMNTAVFGSKTMVQAAVDYNPHVVIVALGANDAFRAGQVGGVGTVINEAQQLFSTLRAELPAVPIFYGSTPMIDTKHANLNALVNRCIMPAWWQKKTTGLMAGLWCKEIQGDAVAADIRAGMQNWVTLDNNVKGFAEVSGFFELPLWKCARLGLISADGLHPGAVGHKMFCANARNFLQANTAFRALQPYLSSQGGGEFNDFELVFNGLVSDNGNEWVTKSNPSTFVLHTMRNFGPWSAELCDSWFYPSKGSVVSSNLIHNRTAPQVWMIRGSKPNAIVQVTGNETSWLPTNLITDSRGDTIECGAYTGLPNGVYTLRYRVDDEAYGPLTITVSGSDGGGGTNGNYALTTGTNATGTWPISITGTIQGSQISPAGQYGQVLTWSTAGWAPYQVLKSPGWQLTRESANIFRVFPVTDNIIRAADGGWFQLGTNGTTFGFTHSGEWTAGANSEGWVYFSPNQNRLIFANVLPTLIQGLYHYPNDPSFVCLGKIRTNSSGQLQDDESYRGVCSAYNQAPRTLKIAPLAAENTGLSAHQAVNIGTCTYISCFPGAVVDWSGFGQVGCTNAASYNRLTFTHDSTAASTGGGDSPVVFSHSLRSTTSMGLNAVSTTLTARCTSGSTLVMGGYYGVQARGMIHHNW